jgi:hypothetical protein
LIPEGYRTAANNGNYVLNLGNQRTTFFAQGDDAAPAAPEAAGPEKVESFSWTHAARHTTFYGQNDSNATAQALVHNANATNASQPATALAQSDFDANQEPEKIHTLVPESYRSVANDIIRNPTQRTAFYAQEK